MLHLRDPEDFKGQPCRTQADGKEWKLQKGITVHAHESNASIDWNEAKVRAVSLDNGREGQLRP